MECTSPHLGAGLFVLKAVHSTRPSVNSSCKAACHLIACQGKTSCFLLLFGGKQGQDSCHAKGYGNLVEMEFRTIKQHKGKVEWIIFNDWLFLGLELGWP